MNHSNQLANNILSGLQQNQSKGGVLDILLAAEQADQFCPKFTTGQRNDLEYLAANEDTPGHSTARALLLQETGAVYDTELYFPMNPRNLMLKKPNADIPSLMRIHPNPTNDLVYISFKMPQGDIKAEIELHDSMGKMAHKADVSQSNGLVENLSQPSLMLYPNPATDQLNIILPPGVNRAEVYSLSGQLVMSQYVYPGWDRAAIDVSGIAGGMYMVRVVGVPITIGREEVMGVGRFVRE